MLLAIAMEKGEIASHYSHSERFDVYEIKDLNAAYVRSIDYTIKDHENSFNKLQSLGVNAIVLDMIGDEAYEHLVGRSIDVYFGQRGNFQIFLDDFMHGRVPLPKVTIEDQENSCSL